MSNYEVNFWGSKPGTNDDCWNGEDFELAADAMFCFLAEVDDTSTAWIELIGPNTHIARQNPDFVKSNDNDDDWNREVQMQDAMMHGVDGYNQHEGM